MGDVYESTPDGLRLLRTSDLLSFTLRSVGFDLDNPLHPTKLVRRAPVAFLIYEFPPQAIVEEADPDAAAPAQARMAGPTRLVFQPKSDVTELPIAIDRLLDWSRFDLAVRQTAQMGKPDPQRETAIEAPWGLFLSPIAPEQFEHARVPISRRGAIDLWQTRLRERAGGELPRLRALYARPTAAPGHQLLDPETRAQIVKLTSRALEPVPPRLDDLIELDDLYLSTLGATLGAHAAWPNAPDGTLVGWRHRSAFGRDHFIKTMHRGRLWPYGHRATLIQISQRTFTQDGQPAILKTKNWIVLKDHVMTYTADDRFGRQLPYTSVEILTRITSEIDFDNPNTPNAFWPLVSGTQNDFPFRVRATDRSNNTSELNQALGFAAEDPSNWDFTRANIEAVKARVQHVSHVFAEAAPPRSQVALAGQKVAFINEVTPGDATLEVAHLMFDTTPLPAVLDPSVVANAIAPFRPILQQAGVLHSAVKQVVQGMSTAANPALIVNYCENYLDQQLHETANDAQIFLQKIQGTPSAGLDFLQQGADKVGGIVAPQLDFSGFSQTLGVMSGPLDGYLKQAAQFDPAKFLGGAKLLGIISLSEILQLFNVLDDLKAIPQLKTLAQNATEIVSGFQWETKKLKAAGPFKPLADCRLAIDVRVAAHLVGAPSVSTTVDGTLEKFAIEILDVIRVEFESLKFHTKVGERPTLEPKVKGVSFLGDLSFLSELQKLLDSANLPGPFIDVDLSAITAGFRLGLPSIGFGIFSLQNLMFAADLQLHFGGDPFQFDFAFCDADHPFLVSVGIFGGGGHFKMGLTPRGVTYLEAALEFGGCVELALGVASGGVYILAGIYYRYDAQQGARLTAFVRAGGSLDVLGLITISVEFYLGLSADFRPDAIYLVGDASLTVTVSVLFFSADVTLSIHREFKGPTLTASDTSAHAHVMGMRARALHAPAVDEEQQWNQYWDAFAA